jgi:predicted transposase/invertase (TIGR01784 family)
LEKVTILSTNRDLEQNVKKGAKMLAVDIEKIPFYQDGKAVGLKEGIQKGIQKGIQEGIQKGIEKGTRMIAIQMLKANVDIDIILKCTNLSIQKLNELKKELG